MNGSSDKLLNTKLLRSFRLSVLVTKFTLSIMHIAPGCSQFRLFIFQWKGDLQLKVKGRLGCVFGIINANSRLGR